MTKRTIHAVGLLACTVLLGTACGSFDGPGLGSDSSAASNTPPWVEPTRALMAYPAKGAFKPDDFYDFPYPSDLRLDKDGTPALAAIPLPKPAKACRRPAISEPTLDALLKGMDPQQYLADAAATSDRYTVGFGTNSAIYFRFTRDLHPKIVPTPAQTLSPGSPCLLVNIDPSSAEGCRSG